MPLFDNIESVADPYTYCEYNLGGIELNNGFNPARSAIQYQESYSNVYICHDGEICYQYTQVDSYVGQEVEKEAFLKSQEFYPSSIPLATSQNSDRIV